MSVKPSLTKFSLAHRIPVAEVLLNESRCTYVHDSLLTKWLVTVEKNPSVKDSRVVQDVKIVTLLEKIDRELDKLCALHVVFAACQVSRIVTYSCYMHILFPPPVVDPTAGLGACGCQKLVKMAVRDCRPRRISAPPPLSLGLIRNSWFLPMIDYLVPYNN